MEEFIIAGRPVSILSKEEIDQEIDKATLDRREADFSGKSLKFLSLAEKNLDYGINLENSWIAGNVFMASTTVNGDINLANAVIDGSFFFGRGKLMGNLILERAKVGQTVNMVGLNVTGSLLFANARVNGFISLAKAVILGDVDFRRVEVYDYSNGDLTVKGDVYLKSAQINGFFDISEAAISGMVSLENALIRRNLLAKNSSIKDAFTLKNSLFNKEFADFSGIAPEKIIN
jgi:cytoskeletal protein CcmA (bactofilin family)